MWRLLQKSKTMGDHKNLSGTEAVKEIQKLAGEIKTCMFCTYENGKLKARPMSSQQVDDQGVIWFLSDKNSEKNKEVLADSTVDLLYGQGNDKFLSLRGNAALSFDKAKIKELWDPIAKIWFKEGVDDPNVSIIKVTISEGYYWDTKHGKVAEIAAMATALITGKTMDDGIEGTLTVSRID